MAVHATFEIPAPGSYLLPNDTKTILWIEAPENARKSLMANVGRVKMSWTYCSVYEECWEATLDPQQLEQREVPKQTPAMTFRVSKAWFDAFSAAPSPQPAEQK